MTIEIQSYFVEYEITESGPGIVSFPFDFSVSDASEIHCFDVTPGGGGENDSVEIPSGQFSVTASANGFGNGGSVTLLEPLTIGRVLRIERMTPKTQRKTFSNQRFIDPAEIERALDKLTRITQESSFAEVREIVTVIEGDVAAMESALSAAEAGIVQNTAAVSALQQSKADMLHAARHAAGGPDAVSPASIGAVEEAPADGKQYARQDGAWAEVDAGGGSADLPDGGAPGDILGLDASDEPAWLTPLEVANGLPFASAAQAGVVKPDNVTVFVTNGVISAVGGGSGNVVATSTDNIIDPNTDETQTVVNTGFRGRLSALEGNQTAFITAAQAGNMVAAVVEPLSEKVGELNTDLAAVENTVTEMGDVIGDLANAVATKLDDAPHDDVTYGRNNGEWVEVETDGGGSISEQIIHVQEQQPSGVQGGTFTAGAWRTRNINAVVRNTIKDSSLSNGQITLPAGLYEVSAYGVSAGVLNNRTAILNSNSEVLLLGGTVRGYNSSSHAITSPVEGILNFSTQTIIFLAHRCEATNASAGFGYSSGSSNWGDEIYAELFIRRIK